MRRIRVKIRKGQVVEPSDLPDEVEGYLTVAEGDDHRRRLLVETNRAYAALRADTKAWNEEQQERALWDGTLADGMESGDQES
ncbi:MAG: toxin-antitoxin system protein [bacterium]